MKINIKGEDVMELVTNRLNHLLECREFLSEFFKLKLDETLIAAQAKDKYEHNQTRLKDALERYNKLCRDHALSTRSPVQLWLDDVEELEAVEDLVKYKINDASGGPYGDGLPRELNSRLRSLTNFDDSE